MITVNAREPQTLLKQIKAAIDDGEVRTWSYDKDGDFTHNPDQWIHKAWLPPTVDYGVLKFGILKPKDSRLSQEVYAVYHGRFFEMLLAHFDDQFSTACASAQVGSLDRL